MGVLGWLKSLFVADAEGLYFGGLRVSDEKGEGGFMLVGVPGTGKTVVIDMVLRQVLPPIADGSRDDRALIYDPKREYISKLQRLGYFDPVSAGMAGTAFDPATDATNVVITNPLDERGLCWEVAKDFDRLLDARQFATVLTADAREYGSGGGTDKEFFVESCTQLFQAVFKVLHRRKPYRPGLPGSGWSLRDFILAFEDYDDLEMLLNGKDAADDTRKPWNDFLGKAIMRGETGPSVVASVGKYLGRIRDIAAAWDAIRRKHPSRTFSFREWVNGRKILILGSSERYGPLLHIANRLLFHKAAVELFEHRRQNDAARNTWVVLDELPELGHLTDLHRLLAKGRSWGIRVLFAFQNYSQLREVFGDHQADSIVSLAHTFAVFNCGVDTAERESKMFGEYTDQQGRSRPRVSPTDITDLPVDPVERGVVGWYYSKRLPEPRARKRAMPWSEVKKTFIQRDGLWDTVERENEEDFALKIWEDEERAVLKLGGRGRIDQVPTYDGLQHLVDRLKKEKGQANPVLQRVQSLLDQAKEGERGKGR